MESQVKPLLVKHMVWKKSYIVWLKEWIDAVKVGNELTYDHMGILCFGDQESGLLSEKVKSVATFFDEVGFPYEIDQQMDKRQWGKFMLNVGVNQTVAVYKSNYGEIQKEGPCTRYNDISHEEVIICRKKKGYI